MPNGTFFQQPTAPSLSAASSTTTIKSPSANGNASSPNPDADDSSTELTSAIDDFISEIEGKFKVISNEILSKCMHFLLLLKRSTHSTSTPLSYRFPFAIQVLLVTADPPYTVDDMAERCDRIEAELQVRGPGEAEGDEAGGGAGKKGKGSGS
ncbi:MAG: hypothetical protein Q9160_006854 [Pyrenula sp. 1 TL-2023]